MGFDADIGVESKGRFFGNLGIKYERRDCSNEGRTYMCLGFFDMVLLEEELTVEVGDVNGIKIDLTKEREREKGSEQKQRGEGEGSYHNNIFKSGEHQVLEQFTPNPTSPNHQDPA